jgi:opacity protein-like surface antigen
MTGAIRATLMNHLKKTCLLSIALAAVGAVPSFAADLEQPKNFDPYIGIFGGLDFLPGISGTDQFFLAGPGKLNTKVGDFAGAVIGVQFNDIWRFEAEVSRSYNGINNFTFNNGNVNTYQGAQSIRLTPWGTSGMAFAINLHSYPIWVAV